MTKLSNASMISTDTETQRQEKLRISDLNSKHNRLINNINKSISSRLSEDKIKYQEFLESRGLMKYYDRFWDLGCECLEELATFTVEDLNVLYIPVGHQLKIEKGLVSLGYKQKNVYPAQTQIIMQPQKAALQVSKAIGTEAEKEGKSKFYKNGKLNFGLKLPSAKKKKVDSIIKGIPRWIKLKLEDSGEIAFEHENSVQSIIEEIEEKKSPKTIPTKSKPQKIKKAKMASFSTDTNDLKPLLPHELNVNKEAKAKRRVNNFVSPQVQTQTSMTSTSTQAKKGILKKSFKKHRGTKKVNFSIATASRKPVQNSFSFSNFGGKKWVNNFDSKKIKQTETFTTQTTFTDKVLYASSTCPLKKKKLACYMCLSLIILDEAIYHPKIVKKVFCSERCKKMGAEMFLVTCEVCYSLLDKTVNGVPARDKWVCSQSCKLKLKAQSDQDFGDIKQRLERTARLRNEVEYQEVDLDLEIDCNN